MSQVTQPGSKRDALAPTAAGNAADRRPLPLSLLILVRPKQWSKNLLVFAAFIFTASFRDPVAIRNVLIAFAALCLASSFVYVLNDILDVKSDRLHPRKKFRPIASGAVSIPLAIAVAVVALLGSGALSLLLSHTSMAVLGTYVALQVLYNFGLKKVAVADVFLISLGFILRAALGAAALSVTISSWLLFCTGALALMLGFSKRRSEFILLGDRRGEVRESLASYSKSSLDALVVMFACGAALCYGVYAVQSPTAHRYPGLILTTVFVFYGICRYVLIVFGKDEGGEPETLLYRDPHLLFSIVMFLVFAVLAMSGVKV
ncbi:MAG TPA: decaprenyl-phosphate phosphoribosyltransferase, partial [Fimbriimonadaceae bacterium]|nr:decaprenyl-phosphate phosphoribosyltransferase [Fimbriimonadaceae bacterium]